MSTLNPGIPGGPGGPGGQMAGHYKQDNDAINLHAKKNKTAEDVSFLLRKLFLQMQKIEMCVENGITLTIELSTLCKTVHVKMDVCMLDTQCWRTVQRF